MSEITKILLIDDDETLIESLKLYLTNCGYGVETAGCGEEAFEKLGQHEFDIALCDYNLPDIKGLEIVTKISEEYPSVAPVLITGERLMDLAMEAMRKGAYDYLVKPVDFGDLNRVLTDIKKEKSKEKPTGKEDNIGEVPSRPASGNESGISELIGLYALGEETEKLLIEKGFDSIENIASADIQALESIKGIGPVKSKKLSQTAKEMISEKSGGYSKGDESALSPEDGEDGISSTADKEKTIFDFVIDKTRQLKNKIKLWGLFAAGLILVFFAVDTVFIQFTAVGRRMYNRLWPPSMVIDSVPAGADIQIITDEGDNILPPNSLTPVQVSQIMPGEYRLVMERDGFNRLTNTITVSETAQDDRSIAIPGARREFADGITQKFILPFELTVEIDSEPQGAEVFINDRRIGVNTPVSLDLSVDRYNIVLEYRDFEPLGSRAIGDTRGRCLLDLRPDSDSDIDTDFWTMEKINSRISLRGSFLKEVTVNSSPEGAEVYINDEPAGPTPLETRLPAGTHRVNIQSQRYEDWEGEISIPGDKELFAELRRIINFIARDKDNPDKSIEAELQIDGRRISGRTPIQVPVSAGSRRVTFNAPGYQRWTRTLNIGRQNNIRAHMDRIRHPVSISVKTREQNIPLAQASVTGLGQVLGETEEDGSVVVELPEGSNLIEVNAEGYEKKRVELRVPYDNDILEVYLAEDMEYISRLNQDTQAAAERENGYSVLIIDTRPDFPGAEIYFNGEKIGETIRRMPEVPAGRHTISINHPFTGSVDSVVDIDPGERIIVNFNSVGEAVIK